MNNLTETIVQILFKLSELLTQMAIRIAAIETGMTNGRKAAREAQKAHATRLDEIHGDVREVKETLAKMVPVPLNTPVTNNHPHWLTVLVQDQRVMGAIVTVLIALAGYLGHLQGRNSNNTTPEQTVLERNSASHNLYSEEARFAGRDGG